MTNPDKQALRALRTGFLCGLLWLGLLGPSPAWADGRVLVIWAENTVSPPDAPLLQDLGRRTGVEWVWVREMADGISLLEWRGSSATSSAVLLEELAADPHVKAVQPEAMRHLQFVPQDPLYASQWYLYESVGIEAEAAWDLQRGSSAVVIAVLDTGIIGHADIDSTRILSGYDFFSNITLDNDVTPGRDADPTDPGDAVVAGECGVGSSAEDSSWHGLAVSGVMMATVDNTVPTGVAGIDHRAWLLPIRVLGKCGALMSDILDALRWAAGLPVTGAPLNPNPADVINLSFGGDGACGPVEQAVVDEVIGSGAILVAAAGNGDGVAGIGSGDVALVSPASCQGVIAVAAVSRAGVLASYSKVGEEVSISAAAGDGPFGVATTHNDGLTIAGNDDYAAFQGTSFSCAQTSAVAALMRAEKPGATPAQIRQALQSSAKPFPDASCTTQLCGAGLLNAEAAIQAAGLLPAAPVASSSSGGGGCTPGSAARPEWLWWMLLFWIGRKYWQRNISAHREV